MKQQGVENRASIKRGENADYSGTFFTPDSLNSGSILIKPEEIVERPMRLFR